jgi:hypothetical protein
MPSFRLIAKEKQADGRCRKAYEKEPKTPYERLMESPDISEERKAGLKRGKESHCQQVKNLCPQISQIIKEILVQKSV